MSQSTDLTIGSIVSNSFGIGVKNAPSLLGAILLWAVTIWIPYLNVGTTIGLLGIVAKMGRGSIIPPTEIFDPAYRKQMGEFFLVLGFTLTAVVMGYCFLLIPGIVISLAWSLAPMLVVDKGLNPTEAIQRSNNLTYGKKWTMLLGSLVTACLSILCVGLLFLIGRFINMGVGIVLAGIGYFVVLAIGMGGQAYIYNSLTAAPIAE